MTKWSLLFAKAVEMMSPKDFEPHAAKIASARMDSASSSRISCSPRSAPNTFANACNATTCDSPRPRSALSAAVKTTVFVVLTKFVATIAFVKHSSPAASTTASRKFDSWAVSTRAIS